MITIKALIISPDEAFKARLTNIGTDLDSMQAAIGGGWLEVISGTGWSAYCDEEGKIKGLPINVRATRLARLLGWPVGDTLSGTVVFFGPTEEQGDDTDVTDLVTGSAALLKYL